MMNTEGTAAKSIRVEINHCAQKSNSVLEFMSEQGSSSGTTCETKSKCCSKKKGKNSCTDCAHANSDDVEKIFENLRTYEKKDINKFCENLIDFAHMNTFKGFLREIRRSNNFARAMHFVEFNQNDVNVVVFCKALFLALLSQHHLLISEAKDIEVAVAEFMENVVPLHSNSESKYDMCLHMLPKPLKARAATLFKVITPCARYFEINDITVSYLNMKSMHDLAAQVPGLDETDFFNTATVFLIVEKLHSFIMSSSYNVTYNLAATDGPYDFGMAVICQCLYVFETVFFQNPRKQRAVLNHEGNSFLKCVSRHISFCLKALFKKAKGSDSVESADNIDFEKKTSVVPKHIYIHQTCLIAMLRCLLNVHPNYDSDLHEITPALMEKLLICFLETSYSSLDCKFELCLMSVELMVNLTEFELIDRGQFAKMCLMKFTIGKFTYLSIEILIKVLVCSLERVIALGSLKKPENQEQAQASDSEIQLCLGDGFGSVYHVAEEHMEHSFICSYLCVFLSYFCDVKPQFLGYVADRMSTRMAETAIVVMGKFKEFIPLMGRQNGQAFDMLDRAIRVFLRMVKKR